jgi:hypothetical protein
VPRPLALIAALAACGGAPPSHAVSPSAPTDAATPAGPTAAECSSLLEHAIELAAASHPATTDADRAKLRADLEPELAPKCRAMSATTYACASAAATTDALAACDSAQP